MSNLQTYTFHETGIIPGIANPTSPDGQFHAGQKVVVDLDTGQIVRMGLMIEPGSPPTIIEEVPEGEIPVVAIETQQ